MYNISYVLTVNEDVCWKCGGNGEIEQPICGHCEHGTPHSSCDDTWMAKVLCDVCRPIIDLTPKFIPKQPGFSRM